MSAGAKTFTLAESLKGQIALDTAKTISFTAGNTSGDADLIANGKLGQPRRGQMWDGRASTLAIQAQGPFTGPHEMANTNNQQVLEKLLASSHLNQYRTVFGNVFIINTFSNFT